MVFRCILLMVGFFCLLLPTYAKDNLNLLAFYFHQIFSLSDYQYQTVRAAFSAHFSRPY